MDVPSNDFVEPHPEDEAGSSSSFSEAIIDVYETLTENLEPQNLLGSLYQERIITNTEMDRIKAASVVYRQNDELLSAVRRRSDKDILRFCQILLRKQKHCGMALKGGKIFQSQFYFNWLANMYHCNKFIIYIYYINYLQHCIKEELMSKA